MINYGLPVLAGNTASSGIDETEPALALAEAMYGGEQNVITINMNEFHEAHTVYRDTESGLYYNRHRYYLPEIGRYASRDPIGYRSGPNPYVYALKAPSVAYDPSGLFVPLVIIGGLLLKAAIGAGIDVGMQAGTQVLGQVKDNWDNGRDSTDVKWQWIDINWEDCWSCCVFRCGRARHA